MFGDFFRHGSNALLGTAALAIGGAGATGAVKLRPLGIAAGAMLFFASEYGTHRYLFHAKPASNAFVRRLQHRLHYDHHLEPAKLELLFLPPWFLGPNLTAFGAAYA
ncbi:MAG: fatty acid hydroxylase family protein, partial [Candidatus Eremiobacteraeota bacterium]|nr:fatty acid hydroxylase family protein [Candidatus Eremiobacteraeota bacterium]